MGEYVQPLSRKYWPADGKIFVLKLTSSEFDDFCVKGQDEPCPAAKDFLRAVLRLYRAVATPQEISDSQFRRGSGLTTYELPLHAVLLLQDCVDCCFTSVVIKFSQSTQTKLFTLFAEACP